MFRNIDINEDEAEGWNCYKTTATEEKVSPHSIHKSSLNQTHKFVDHGPYFRSTCI